MLAWVKSLFRPEHQGPTCHSPIFVTRSPDWPRLRKKWIGLHPKCEVCGTTCDCDVHHLTPVHWEPSLELREDNLQTLCRVHHFWFGHLGSWYSYNPTAIEDAAAWRLKIKERPV